ncbi:MAG: phosphoenolpyruvate--protein phosphotransferase [Opitutales bacterium]
MDKVSSQSEQILKGIAASPGVVHGRVFLLVHKELKIPENAVPKEEKTKEIERFEKALLQTRQQVIKVQHEVTEKLGEEEGRIFDAHLLVLEDRALIEETIREFDQTGKNIAFCFHTISQRYIDVFNRIDDEYLRERVADIRDVSKRLLQNLIGEPQYGLSGLAESRVVVAKDIAPSETASIEKGKVLALVTDAGSKTSHAVIMARSIQVPAVVGLHNFSKYIKAGDWVLVDGYEGLVVVNPSEKTLFQYGKLQEKKKTLEEKIFAESRHVAMTKDEQAVTLMANIEGMGEVENMIRYRADGVGLFRTEYLFLHKPTFPKEEEQFQVYKKVAEAFNPAPVIIRTLDLGGDKFPADSYFFTKEENPFLGYRAIRLCLDNIGLFKEQLRAILRASAFGNVKLMYPMISGVEELESANSVLEEVKEDLRKKGIEFDGEMEVGSMIEIPSAAITADILARKCDFFSIGTNDLIQYLLAIDRVNDRVAHLYEPTHPAVLRMIKNVVDAAHAHHIPVGICGEIAGDPLLVPILLGLGIDELSMVPSSLPAIKYMIRHITFCDMKNLSEQVLTLSDPKEILCVAERFYKERVTRLMA